MMMNILHAKKYIIDLVNKEGLDFIDERGDKIKQLFKPVNVSFDNPIKVINGLQILPDFDSYWKGVKLQDYCNQLITGKLGSFEYTYGNRFIEHFSVNQLDEIKNKLINNLNTRRAIAITFDPVIDNIKFEIPCLQLIQLTYNPGTNKVDLTCYFRSNDISGAWYANMIGLGSLCVSLLYGTGLEAGKIHYVGMNAHIREEDFNNV